MVMIKKANAVAGWSPTFDALGPTAVHVTRVRTNPDGSPVFETTETRQWIDPPSIHTYACEAVKRAIKLFPHKSRRTEVTE